VDGWYLLDFPRPGVDGFISGPPNRSQARAFHEVIARGTPSSVAIVAIRAAIGLPGRRRARAYTSARALAPTFLSRLFLDFFSTFSRLFLDFFSTSPLPLLQGQVSGLILPLVYLVIHACFLVRVC
jgi:hypothetical protein